MKKSKVALIVLIAVSLVVLAAGCGWVENLKLFKGGDKPAEEGEAAETVIEQGLSVESEKPEDDEGGNAATAQTGTENPAQDMSDTKQVVLYFANADGNALESETRDIPKQEGIARATINQLIAGPESEGLYPTLPAAAILDDINISNGLCTVDFSSELLEDLTTDNQSQLLAVYSIVNTLTQFDTVDYVQILVDGKAVGQIGGVNASEALAPMYSF